MKQTDQLFWVWLAEALGAANGDFIKLIRLYETPNEIFLAEAEELERVKGLSKRTVAALSDKSLEKAAAILENCQRLGVGLMPYSSELYPQLLREIKRPPILLYYAGTIPRFDKRLCLGMVGMRKMSEYGMETAYKIAFELATANAVVVSGMAEGIDGVCAAAAMQAGGDTVAVLGCGLDVVYPPHHGKLMNTIAQKGLLLSEYPPGTRPVSYHFPTRNRIISGLSQGVVVVEAGVGSGSLITAREAIVQSRDVFAIPSNTKGTHEDGANGLLRDGATFAADAGDILHRYRYLFAEAEILPERRKALQNLQVDIPYLVDIGVIKQSSKQATTVSSPAQTRQVRAKPSPKKPEPKPAQARETVREQQGTPTPKPTTKTPDAVLMGLSPVELAVLQAIPDDRAVSLDSLTGLGYAQSELLTALTMLELAGLLQKLPGSLYAKQ